MRKRLTMIALGSLIACIAVVPGALGNKGQSPKAPKQAPGSISLMASPSIRHGHGQHSLGHGQLDGHEWLSQGPDGWVLIRRARWHHPVDRDGNDLD